MGRRRSSNLLLSQDWGRISSATEGERCNSTHSVDGLTGSHCTGCHEVSAVQDVLADGGRSESQPETPGTRKSHGKGNVKTAFPGAIAVPCQGDRDDEADGRAGSLHAVLYATSQPWF
jgi:hypothetical protein